VHLLLTDRLTCPRCGPTFGLVLLAERVEERRVLEGALGCPNCRDRYPVRGGFGDLRPPPRGPLPGRSGEGGEGAGGGDDAPDADPDAVSGIAAALGLGEGPGTTLLVGDAVRFAPALARIVPDVEVAALDARTRDWTEAPGVSRLVSGAGLPFFGGMLRGVVLAGPRVDLALATEAARVVAPRHRVVVVDAPDPVTRLAPVFEAVGLPRLVQAPGMLAAGR
jgi:uncharacterized protein YbaR (Trm112 family)